MTKKVGIVEVLVHHIVFGKFFRNISILLILCTLRLDDGSCRMYYTGQSVDGKTSIGVARLEGANSQWKREQASISFSLSD